MPKAECPFELANAEFEVALFELGLEKDPDDLSLLYSLAYAYTTAGRYGDGLLIDRKLCDALPDNPHCLYNLACSYSLIGDGVSANETLLRAIHLGYRAYDELVKDADLEFARNHPSFGIVSQAMREHPDEEKGMI